MITIPDEAAAEALATLRELSGAEAPESKTDLRRERAATNLLRLYLTQGRYNLHPQTPTDFEHHAKIRGSAAKALEEMTHEELLQLQRELLGDDYPGKPA